MATTTATGSSYGGAAAGKAPRRASTGKPHTTHSRSYPRGVGVDFKKLAGLTLLNYIDHHGACDVVGLFLIVLFMLASCATASLCSESINQHSFSLLHHPS